MKSHLFLTAAAFVMLTTAPALAENAASANYEAEATMEASAPNVVDVVTSDANFSTLASALTAADLVTAVQGTENVTIFAPTNDAFDKLPAGTLDDLLMPENKAQLQTILKEHIVTSVVPSSAIAMGETEVMTLEGTTITVEKDDDGVEVEDADVIKADMTVSNGVVHVIDEVIITD